MGRRKLRFDVRKYYDKNPRAPKKLIVSIPLQSLPHNSAISSLHKDAPLKSLANATLTTHQACDFNESSLTVQDSTFDTLPPSLPPLPPSLPLPLSSLPPSLSLTVHTPPSNCVVHQHHNELALTVNIPLSSYTSLPTHDSNRLRERLTNTAQLIPETWTLCRGSFILTMVNAMCNMLYTLSVALNCSWTLSVGPYQIDAQKCHLLHIVPLILTCVDHIVALMKLLDQSKLCQGNAEPKFVDLLHHHKGVLKNRNG